MRPNDGRVYFRNSVVKGLMCLFIKIFLISHIIVKMSYTALDIGTIKITKCFLFLYKNILYGYSLEAPRWGASNEYHNICICWKMRRKLSIFWLKLAYLELWVRGIHFVFIDMFTYLIEEEKKKTKKKKKKKTNKQYLCHNQRFLLLNV